LNKKWKKLEMKEMKILMEVYKIWWILLFLEEMDMNDIINKKLDKFLKWWKIWRSNQNERKKK
jgi:hypothetical protein